MRHAGLDFSNFGLERLGLVLVALAHGLSDRLGGIISAALRLLDLGARFALFRVEGDNAIRHRIGAATCESGVESLRIGSDIGDVVHGRGLCLFVP